MAGTDGDKHAMIKRTRLRADFVDFIREPFLVGPWLHGSSLNVD
jgi:hypothetical protein